VEGICGAAARALHVPLLAGGAEDPVVQVSHAIAARGRVLLILDNFEQVADLAPATVGRWLELAPAARLLVTTRVRLGLADEVVLTLEPLTLPGEDPEGDSEAVDLFVERARAARPGLRLEPRDLDAVRAVVRALDGLPLAIELAAARLSILTPPQLLERLEARFELLRARHPTGTGRQATLRATIDWSWSLLEPWEQATLAQLSVFAGGFTADAAEGVVDLAPFPDAPWTLDVLQALGDKSLVRSTAAAEHPAELRLGLYESIREYAARRLDEMGGRAAAEARHEAWFLRTCGAWAEAVGGRDSVRLRQLLSLETENLAAVRDRARARLAAARGVDERRRGAAALLAAVLALDPVLRARGPFARHLAWLEDAVDSAALAGVEPAFLARGYLARGEVRRTKKRSAESGEDFSRAVALARTLGDRRLEGRALHGLANLSHGQARVEDSVRLFEEALAVQRAAGDRAGEGETLGALGAIAIWLAKLDEAQRRLEEALRCLREDGDARFEGFVLVALGALCFERGESTAARRYVEQAVDVLAEADDLRYQGEAAMYLAFMDWEAGSLDAARAHAGRALAVGREIGDVVYQSRYLALLAAVDACAGRVTEAREGLRDAESLAAGCGSSLVVLTVSLLRGQLEVALARAAAGRGDAAARAQHLADARARVAPARAKGPPDSAHPEGAPPPCEVCDEVRFVLRMLERALDG
jgi:predicted ATPase